jgi:hypothetical protein
MDFLLAVDQVGHISIFEAHGFDFLSSDHQIFMFFGDDACLMVVIRDVEMSGFGEWTVCHVEDAFIFIVPV